MQAPVVVMSIAPWHRRCIEVLPANRPTRYTGGRQADGTQGTVIKYHSSKDVKTSPTPICVEVQALNEHSVADIIRSCLGPKSMLKMLLDPMGGIVLTNDGHAILREIEVAHPAAKSMIELSRTQDEEVGDGTTTVIILGTDKAISLVARQADWK